MISVTQAGKTAGQYCAVAPLSDVIISGSSGLHSLRTNIYALNTTQLRYKRVRSLLPTTVA